MATPRCTAFVLAADLSECALNLAVSTPDAFMMAVSQDAAVEGRIERHAPPLSIFAKNNVWSSGRFQRRVLDRATNS
jgi:hypothetical protein